MKALYIIIPFLLSALSLRSSWEPAAWNSNVSLSSAQQFTDNVQYLESTDEYKLIITQHQFVCVLFYKTSCMDQTIDIVAQNFAPVIFLKVNVDKFPSFAEFKAYPAILLYEDGQAVYLQLGIQTVQELSATLHKYFGV